MKLKAIYKFENEPVLIKPVLWPWRTGLEYDILTGWQSGSVFTLGRDHFIFPWYTQLAMAFVWIWYWLSRYAYIKLRYQWPARIKKWFKKEEECLFS